MFDPFLIVFFAIIALISALIIFVFIIYNKYANFVIENSISLKNLKEINDKYKFYESTKKFNEEHTYDNEKFYDSISCEDYLVYELQFKKYDIEKEIKNINYNKLRYNEYCKEVETVKNFGNYEKPTEKLKINRLIKIESGFFTKKQLKPKIMFDLTVALFCSKINGDVYKRKKQTFYSEEITLLINRLDNKTRGFYNDRGIWDAICRVERGRVSNKMRFSIYKRDGYRCRICGRGEKADFLEIDHIKPIAKGGKSTYDNLQTLCRRCNKEKGDTY